MTSRKLYPASMRKELRCRRVTSRAIGDKGLFLEVSKAKARPRAGLTPCAGRGLQARCAAPRGAKRTIGHLWPGNRPSSRNTWSATGCGSVSQQSAGALDLGGTAAAGTRRLIEGLLSAPGILGALLPSRQRSLASATLSGRDSASLTVALGCVLSRLAMSLFHVLRTQLGPRLRSEKGQQQTHAAQQINFIIR
jgi:hypothetical protein